MQSWQIDEDECVTGHHACHVFATCSNIIGSYTCQCNEGWTGNGKHCSGNELFLQINVHIQNILQALFYIF